MRFSRSSVARLAAVTVVVWAAGLIGLANPATAAGSAEPDEQAMAERFAPVVRLVNQDNDCGAGEAFQPSDVGLVLGDPSVALRGPWAADGVVKVGPTAQDLGERLYGYHLDFPGDALEPGCDYERWAGARTTSSPPTVYAHVATESSHPGRLALQYWFFYPYNDYTNKHEGDWEMVQLLFDAADPGQALEQSPVQVALSQHEGVELSSWSDPKLRVVDGTHVVLHPAAGSHANFYEPALYLGTSADQGFGCDDARTPADEVRPVVEVIPRDPAAGRAAFPWISFEGRWGQREEAFYNGPTGPNTKDSWTHPISYLGDTGRDVSYAVPAAGALGTDATDFFCGAVSRGSEVVRRLAQDPSRILLILAAVTVIVVYLLRLTSWGPVLPLRIARRRSVGQILRAAARLFRAHWRLFIGIGLLMVPVSLLVTVVQAVLLGPGAVVGVPGGGEGGGWRVLLAALFGFSVLGAAIVLVLAATTCALDAIDRGAVVGVRHAYRMALARRRSLFGALLLAFVVVGMLSLTVVLAPAAIVLIVLFALFVPVIVFEGPAALVALRRSSALVRWQVPKTVVLLTISIALAAAAGPALGAGLILLVGAPFPLANIVAGVTYAALMPYIALTMGYLYFDALIRSQPAGEGGVHQDIAPAEIER